MNNFEWNIYLNQNPDLVENNINTKEKAFIHFKMHGKNEKRFYNKKMVDLWENYDWNKYKNNNPKLNSLDERGVFFHYYYIGEEKKDIIFKKEEINFFEQEENYKKYIDLYKNHDWDKYLNIYQDLKNSGIKTNFECFTHYITYGISEGRQIYKKGIINNNFDINSFDYDFFMIMNEHLKNINTKEDAINYLKNIDNDSLDKIIYTTKQKDLYEKNHWVKYINNYDDLKKNIKNEIDGFKHYLFYGINENRKIFDKNNININMPLDFNLNIYYYLYEDLHILDENNLINHYILDGIYENRSYKINLDIKLDINLDINNNDKNINKIIDLLFIFNLINLDFIKNNYNFYLKDNNIYNFIKKCLNNKYFLSNEHYLYNKYLYNQSYYNTLNIYINNYLYIHYEFNNFNFVKYYYDNELYKSILFSKNLILNYFINNCDDIKKNLNLYNILNIENNKNNHFLIQKCKNKQILNFKNIYIVSCNHGNYISKSLLLNLKYLYNNINIEIINDINHHKNIKENLYIYLFNYQYKYFPKNYIIYQLEQIYQSNWIDNNVINNIKKSILTIDYSIYNLNLYKYFIKDYNNYFYNSISLNNNINLLNVEKKYDYDILFFGGLNSRRNNILYNLKKYYNIKIIHDIFGEELYKYIDKSKIIINLHFYKNAILEIPRIYEILNLYKIIISEDSIDINYHDLPIFFIPELNDNLENFNNLTNSISNILNNFNSIEEDYIKKIKIYKSKTNTNNIINLNNIINFTNNNMNLNNEKILLVSCNYGNFDLNEINIKQINNYTNIDWYLFTDDISNQTSDKWNIINKNNNNFSFDFNKLENKKLSKYIKFQIFNNEKFKNYDYFIWIDSSFIIENYNFTNDIVDIIQKNNNVDLFIFEHYKRNKIFEELFAAINLEKYQNQNLMEFYNKIYNDKKYIDNKLYESGFMILKNNINTYNFLNDMYNDIEKYGNMCQLFIPYNIYKNNLNIFTLNENNFVKGNLNGAIWENKLIGRVKHNHLSNKGYSSIIDYKKINYIDKIYWINLDRSLERTLYMTNLLNNINVPNERFSAIDGKNIDVKYIIKDFNLERPLNNGEIACTLSHLKIINNLKNVSGNYFMICEDDIIFDAN